MALTTMLPASMIFAAFIAVLGIFLKFCCIQTALVLVVGMVLAIVSWQKWVHRQHPLMELARGIKGAAPADLTARADRIAAKKALARVPQSQEEELKMLDTTPSPRFAVDDAGWLEHLDKEGYAVVAAVADQADLSRAEDLLWEFLEKTTSWRRCANETWTDEGIGGIGSVQNGLVNGAGMGQSAFLWHLRTLHNVRRVFECIWNTSDLIVSFDGANVFRPWNHGFRKTVGGWWHVDQGRAKQGRHAVQGFVSLTPANSRTGGLTVVPRSHLRFAEIVEDQQNPNIDYCTVQSYCPVFQDVSRRLVCCEPGDLVLWDSRTVHANAPAPETPSAPADKLLRAVGYICMTPKSFAPDDVLIGRRSAYEHRFSTSHWPHKLDLGSGSDEPPQSLNDAPPAVIALVG